MHPDVALRVPLRVLRHAAQRRERREELQQPGVVEHAQRDRRALRLQQQLPPLVEQPLRRDAGEIQAAAQREQLGIGPHVEARGEARHA